MSDYRTKERVPPRALILSLAALAVPVSTSAIFPAFAGEDLGLLLWLAALVPAFLLTYYRGWRGASVGLASGMVALTLAQVLMLYVAARPPQWTLLFGLVAAYVIICLGVGWVGEMLHRARSTAERLALVDPLTGLANRRHLEVFLSAAFAAAERGTPLAIVLFDIDRFKRVNDQFGHAAGDDVIRALGAVLQRETRRSDVSARFGGEEFVTVLPGARREDAVRFAERVRAAFGAERFLWGSVTASAGVALYRAGLGSPDVMVAEADRALYSAKEQGRDRVEVSEWERRARFVGSPADWSGAVEPLPGSAPAVAPRPVAQEPGSGERVNTRGPGGDEIVLVVEDDPQTLGTISRALELLGYRVEQASDPVVALERVVNGRPAVDLILSDIVMPRMSGLTLADRVLRERPATRVLLMSGYDHDDPATRGMPESVSGFLKKPMTLGELAARVRGALDENVRLEAGNPG